MNTFKLAYKSLRHYLLLAIIISLGVAVATAVIVASIITGSSFKISLSKYLNNRRGNINSILQSSSLISYRLTDKITSAVPVLSLSAACENINNAVIPDVKVYGINDKFKTVFDNFTNVIPKGRNIVINQALADDLKLTVNDDIFLNFQKISEINNSTLFADRKVYKNTIKLRFNIQEIIKNDNAGSFIVSGSSSQPRIAYADYFWISKRLKVSEKINLVLSIDVYSKFQSDIQKNITENDLGLFYKKQFVYFKGVLFPEKIIEKVKNQLMPISTYLADELRFNSNSASYLMVSYNPDICMNSNIKDDEIILLKWLADDLKVRVGDEILLSYQRFARSGEFNIQKIKLKVKQIVPNELPYLNSNFSPEIAGVTDVDEIGNWDAPFPFDSKRVTSKDEKFWKLYRAAPRAFVSEKVIKSMWQQQGSSDWVTTMVNSRNYNPDKNFLKVIDLKNFGISVIDYYDMINNASSGKTDMTSLLISTGIFIIASAVLFTLLFMQLMIEYRKKQIGISLACGLDGKLIKKQFIVEGAIISFFGVIVGVFPGFLLSYLLIEKFNTVWRLTGSLDIYHFYNISDIIIAAITIFILILGVIWYNINKNIKEESIVSLIYNSAILSVNNSNRNQKISYLFFALFLITLIFSYSNIMGRFTSAMFLLIALIIFSQNYFSSMNNKIFNKNLVINRFIKSNIKKVLLIIIIISSSVFILMSTATFIKTDKLRDESSASEGYSYRIDFPDQPAFSLASRIGRESAGFTEDDEIILNNVKFVPLFNNAGDDISCVAVDKPTGVKIVGITDEFVKNSNNKYAFSAIKSKQIWTDEETLYWSLKYMGGNGNIPLKDGRSYEYLSATAMPDSIFGSEVLVSEKDFKVLYPNIYMPSVYMISMPGDDDSVIQLLRTKLGPLGAIIRKSSEILKSYHDIQNGYIEIFINFSIIGLLLGVFAHQAIIFRTVWEMRREIAIFNAIGLTEKEILNIFFSFIMVITFTGLLIGIFSALITVIPAISTNNKLISLLLSMCIVILIYICSCCTVFSAVKKINNSNTIEMLKSE